MAVTKLEARVERQGKLWDELKAEKRRAERRRDFWLVKVLPACAAVTVVIAFLGTTFHWF